MGIFGTITHYSILIFFVQFINLNPIISSIAGFIGGALVNYILNYRYTFRSTKRHGITILKFFIIAGIGLVINAFIMTICIHTFHLYYLLAQILATGLVFLWNFTGNLIWTFK